MPTAPTSTPARQDGAVAPRGYGSILSSSTHERTVTESVFIAAGIIFVLGIVSHRQDDPSASALAVSLAALKDWTFLLGPGFIVGWGNGPILGYLMYRSRLVPRGMAILGLTKGFERGSPILSQAARTS